VELQNLIDELHISQYDVLGHSCGGMNAAVFAIAQPKGLSKLILFSTSPDFPLRVSEARRMRAELLSPELVKVLEDGERTGTTTSPEYRAADEEFSKLTFYRQSGPLPEAFEACAQSAAEDNTVPWTFGGDCVFTPGGNLEHWTIVDRLHEITKQTVPGGVLLLMGRWDVNNAKTYRIFEDKIQARTETVVFENSSHMALFEEEQRFLDVVEGFLAKD
jgi:proline-specific peptidase